MEPNYQILRAVAQTASLNIIARCFIESNKFPIKDWKYNTNEETLEGIKNISDKELADHVLEHIDLLTDMINESIENRLRYLESEGFTYRKRGYYVPYTEKEIERKINSIIADD